MKAAIYCRLSKEDENNTSESESIQNQRSMLIQYAIEQNFEIEEIYIDEDYSGIDRERPAFQAMIEAASQKKFDVVLAKTQSRFTRDMELVEKYLHGKFIEWGIRFIAVVDHIDTNDTANKKSRQIAGLVNEWYLEDLSNNVRSVLDHKRKEGKYIASFALYGFQKDPKDKNHLIVDPEAAQVVQRIFTLYLSGKGARQITKILNEEKIPNPTAYKQQHNQHYTIKETAIPDLWSSATIYQMLRNQTYVGDLVQGRHKKVSYKSSKTIWIPKEDWVVCSNTHEGIINRQDFETVQQMLQANSRGGKKGQIHPLARKVLCGDCGTRMEQTGSSTPNKHGTIRRYLRCRLHQRCPEYCSNQTCTNMEDLSELILTKIQKYVEKYINFNQIQLPNLQNQQQKKQQMMQKELEHLQSHQNNCYKAIQKLYLDQASGILSDIQFETIKQSFLQDAEKTQVQIKTIQSELDAYKMKEGQQEIESLLKINQLTRELVCLLIDTVVLSPKNPNTNQQKVVIRWLF